MSKKVSVKLVSYLMGRRTCTRQQNTAGFLLTTYYNLRTYALTCLLTYVDEGCIDDFSTTFPKFESKIIEVSK